MQPSSVAVAVVNCESVRRGGRELRKQAQIKLLFMNFVSLQLDNGYFRTGKKSILGLPSTLFTGYTFFGAPQIWRVKCYLVEVP